jgi:hypothetical protein
MTRQQPLPYLPAVFATCMLFQVLYVLCVAIYFVAPGLPGHAVLTQIFPQFSLLDLPSFIYGLVLSMVYGWFVAATFVFSYNLWPRFAALLSNGKTVTS